MIVSDVLWALLGGAAVGLVGSWLTPGHGDDVPVWLTVPCGIAGVLLGNLGYTSLFAPTNPGPDWWRHAWQLAGAALLVGALVRLRIRAHRRPGG